MPKVNEILNFFDNRLLKLDLNLNECRKEIYFFCYKSLKYKHREFGTNNIFYKKQDYRISHELYEKILQIKKIYSTQNFDFLKKELTLTDDLLKLYFETLILVNDTQLAEEIIFKELEKKYQRLELIEIQRLKDIISKENLEIEINNSRKRIIIEFEKVKSEIKKLSNKYNFIGI